jgi:hypothetical protein
MTGDTGHPEYHPPASKEAIPMMTKLATAQTMRMRLTILVSDRHPEAASVAEGSVTHE